MLCELLFLFIFFFALKKKKKKTFPLLNEIFNLNYFPMHALIYSVPFPIDYFEKAEAFLS